MADSNKTLLWVCGHPCSGKTWIGDYLESRGYKHIDGDYHLQNQKKSEENETIVKSNINSNSNNSNSNKNYSQNNFLKNHQKNLLNISNKEFDSNHNLKKEIF